MSERARRFPANYPVVFRKGPEMYQSTICNISASGGCIIGGRILKNEDKILLDYGIGQTRAIVKWTTGNMAGLQFEEALSELSLLNIRNNWEAA